jgi:hypothetical protein
MMAQSYVPHVTSAIPPPAYTEGHDDLAAQLAQMKAMMEQMRLDKEHLETEVKRKAEEEAAAVLRAKQEMEAAAARQKEKKELDEVFSLFRDWRCIRNGKWSDEVWEFAGKKEIQYLRALEAAGETLLLVNLAQSRYGHWDGVTKNLWSVSIILTNRHLYQLQYKPIEKIPASDEFYSSKLYSFANPLNLAQAKLLSSIVTLGIWSRVECEMRDSSHTHAHMKFMKNFETIIRLIPGGYKNGDWKQLDGFFGMYFNEIAMEVSKMPPPSL